MKGYHGKVNPLNKTVKDRFYRRMMLNSKDCRRSGYASKWTQGSVNPGHPVKWNPSSGAVVDRILKELTSLMN